MRARIDLLGWVMATLVCLSTRLTAGAEESLADKIGRLMRNPEYKQAHWGLLLVDQEWGNVFYEHNADKLFAPASVTKLYSVAAALDAFGADHRFETAVYQRGQVDDAGVLDGDLILVAGGDLTLGGRTTQDGGIAFTDHDHTYANGGTSALLTEPDPLEGLNHLARQIAQRGIKRVRGEILIDDRLFDRVEGTGSGPSRVTPIVVNDNLIDFVIKPAEAGRRAVVEWRPRTDSVWIDARVETVAKGQPLRVVMVDHGANRIELRGEIPEDHKPLVRVQEVSDAAAFARALFIEALVRAGLKVDASVFEANRGEKLPDRTWYSPSFQVGSLVSPPFREEAKLILKVSHNLHASALPLLVAGKNGKRNLAEGLRLQRDFLRRAGVDVETISFGGGAGGSRADYTTPRATVQLLRHMATRPDFAAYEQALPILGIDGTLATVGKESAARGQVRAKTGTLIWENTMNDRTLLTARSLAGYMTTRKERRLTFAFFINNVNLAASSDSAKVMRTFAEICEAAYDLY